MGTRFENLSIGLLLILPGLYLLWYAAGHPEFYRERRWEKWSNRAYILALLFGLLNRMGGPAAVKRAFQIFALTCIAMGIWAAWN